MVFGPMNLQEYGDVQFLVPSQSYYKTVMWGGCRIVLHHQFMAIPMAPWIPVIIDSLMLFKQPFFHSNAHARKTSEAHADIWPNTSNCYLPTVKFSSHASLFLFPLLREAPPFLTLMSMCIYPYMYIGIALARRAMGGCLTARTDMILQW